MQLIYSKHTEKYAKKLKEKYKDKVIGIGGGSVIDAAKIIAKPKACIAIPTTAAGSSQTPYASLWLPDRKLTVETPTPILKKYEDRIKLPAEVRQGTMFDCFSHAMESLWSKNSTNESRRYAAEAIAQILHADNDNELVEAGNLAGRAIAITRTNIVHSVSYSLTLRYRIPHGTACAMLLPYFAEYMGHDVISAFLKSLYTYPLPKINIDIKLVSRDALSYPKFHDSVKRIGRKDLVEILSKVRRDVIG